MPSSIDVAVVELTNRCDLNCGFCPKKTEDSRDGSDLDIELFRRLVNENDGLENSIRVFELGELGNPLLYGDIEEVLSLLHQHKRGINIVTNGLNLARRIAYFDDALLKEVHFSVYLDSPFEEKNDRLMGVRGVFNKTLDSLEYLSSKGLGYDVLMRINSLNYTEMLPMLSLCKHYRCNLLIPMEVLPIGQNNSLLLDPDQKSEAANNINVLVNSRQPVNKTIHFELNSSGLCTYLRKLRLFVNSHGKIGFCHFLSSLKTNEIMDLGDKSLAESIEFNNRLRDEFVQNTRKDKEECSSPCVHCLRRYK